VIYVFSLVLSGGGSGLLSPGSQVLLALGASGYYPLAFGRWWTLLSASWLHGNLLHIASNMYGVWIFVPSIAELYGPGRTVIIYTIGGMTGFLLSSLAYRFLPALPFLHGSPITVGASASMFGLIGAALYYGHRTGSQYVASQAWYYAVAAGALGFMVEGIDNYAHIGGFAGGYLTARLLDPLKHERIDHVVVAVVLLALSIGSIVYSIVPVLIRSFGV
jgi:rhomboid protease GluP